MIYLPDTNTLIARLNGDTAISSRLESLSPDEVVLCAPVLAELEFGANLSARREQNLDRVRRLAAGMRFEEFGAGAARHFGWIKADLRQRGIAKSDFDLAIASIALDLQATLVTSDRALHDGALAELRVEDWRAR